MNESKTATDTARQNLPSLARKNESTYDEFILWFALPLHEKRRMGLETQEQFAEHHGLNRHTVGEWKKRRDFLPRLRELRDTWGRERTQDVIAALYRGALSTGNTGSQDRKLWFQYIEGWSEKQQIEQTNKVRITLTVDDIRFLIEGLPEKYKNEAWDHLREISDLIQLYGDATLLEGTSQQVRPV